MKIPKYSEIVAKIQALPIVRTVIQWMKDHSFPGFLGVPIYDVLTFIINEIKRYDLTTRANSMAFSFFISLFPSIIAIFTLIPYFLPYILNETLLSYLPDGNIDFSESLIEQFRAVLPDNVENRMIEFIETISTEPRFGLFSIGFVLALFFSSNGIMTMMRGFQKSYHQTTFFSRTIVMQRLVSFKLLFYLGTLIISSVFLVIFGNLIIGKFLIYIEASQFTAIILYILRWIVIIMLFYTGISLVYRDGAATLKKFRFFSPGATIATFLSLLSSIIFSLYVDNFGQYNELYESIGTIIVIMLWIQINSFIILIGFELNAAIAVNRDITIARKSKE